MWLILTSDVVHIFPSCVINSPSWQPQLLLQPGWSSVSGPVWPFPHKTELAAPPAGLQRNKHTQHSFTNCPNDALQQWEWNPALLQKINIYIWPFYRFIHKSIVDLKHNLNEYEFSMRGIDTVIFEQRLMLKLSLITRNWIYVNSNTVLICAQQICSSQTHKSPFSTKRSGTFEPEELIWGTR